MKKAHTANGFYATLHSLALPPRYNRHRIPRRLKKYRKKIDMFIDSETRNEYELLEKLQRNIFAEDSRPLFGLIKIEGIKLIERSTEGFTFGPFNDL